MMDSLHAVSLLDKMKQIVSLPFGRPDDSLIPYSPDERIRENGQVQDWSGKKNLTERGRIVKKKPEGPFIPEERQDTMRHTLLAMLEEGPCTAREISGGAGIPEKEVYNHLEHLRKTLSTSGRRLAISPAECRSCGFLFTKRERLKKPGRCPVCRGESIQEPVFSLR